MKYIFTYSHPEKHLLDIEFIVTDINKDETTVHLPRWRPGRYELGNFAKNVKQFLPQDKMGNPVPFHKITKDCWKVHTKNIKELHIKYSYYATELNAGSTYMDGKQLYVNPVNCCIYIPERMQETCNIELHIPDNYQVACSLPSAAPNKKNERTGYKRTLIAKGYHELADSPFIASADIKHTVFCLDGVEFHLWFQGECKPNWAKLINDFFIFINEQFVAMKGPIPSEEYHFLFQILPNRFHHGVEHLSSTVIALGPSYEIMQGDTFLELLSVSSHELFHSWNVKAIRPVEMYPYDYSKENYSRLGFVCEGVTTYYGDFFLFRAGIYSEFEYLKSMFRHLQAHFDNFGRYNLSVTDSSFDTWLDGYTEIVPHRKTSIYSEGCLLALMTDLLIRKYTTNKHSLDDAMIYLYNEFAKKNKGYSETDYKAAIEYVSGHNFDSFFDSYVYKAASYENALIECVDYIGLQLLNTKSNKYYEHAYGIKIIETSACTKVVAIYPDSICEKAGIQYGDEIIAINGYNVKNNFQEWSRYFEDSAITLTIMNSGGTQTISFTPLPGTYYKSYYVQKSPMASEIQKKNFNTWSRRKW